MTGSIPFAIKRNETTAFTRGLLDDVDAAAARATLDLGNAASLDVGTTAGTVAAGDDSRFGGSGDALVANPLSQFAATTSAELAGVISDETGTGALVFANMPTLVTPAIGAATGTSLVLSGNLTGAAATLSQAAGTNPDVNTSANRQLRLIDSTSSLVWGYFARWATNNRFLLGGINYVATDAGVLSITSTIGSRFDLGASTGFISQNGLEWITDGNSCKIRAGSNTTAVRLQIASAVSGTGDILQCTDSALNILAKIDYLGNLTAGSATLSGLLKFTGYTTALLPVATANEGAITYDTTLDKHVGSNGTIWNVLW